MPRILFVCLGNICRSPAAEGIMRSVVGDEPGWTIDSAGTGRYHIGDLPDRRMRVHARSRGLELDHRCRQVRADDFRDFDLVIGMDDANISDLRDMCPTPITRARRGSSWCSTCSRTDAATYTILSHPKNNSKQ